MRLACACSTWAQARRITLRKLELELNNMNYIAKFNPYSMDDETILAVATGRKCLLGRVVKTLEDNLNSESVAQHTLIRGPRGMGKSFFLKYLQITFRQSGKFDNCEFLLLPEEQNNINTPSDLIKLILSELTQQSGVDATTFWEEPDEVWQIELQKLKKYLSEKKSAQKDYMLVVVLENLDTFLHNIKSDKKTAKVHESRFRHLLERIKDLTIIGAVPRVDSDIIDGNYNKRLFHAFKKCTLKKWTTEDYFKYFDRRKDLSGIEMTEAEESLKRAKLKALSHFTGGSPRIAVVLTNLLLEDNVISTANTLFGLIDDLTPYYQDLTKSIPKQSKKLFDTLIRKGENLSQSELAEALGTTQSKISKAFLWLQYNGYVIGTKRSDSAAFSYQVADRIHVLYYQLREINHNQGITPIWLLSDFLVAFYQSDELRTHAFKALLEEPSANANDLAKLYLISSGLFEKESLPELETSDEWLNLIENNVIITNLINDIELYSRYDDENLFLDTLKINFEKCLMILKNIHKQDVLEVFVNKLFVKTSQCFLNKHHKSALLIFNFLLDFYKENGIKDMIDILYCGISICYVGLNDLKSAEIFLEKGISFSNSNQLPVDGINIYKKFMTAIQLDKNRLLIAKLVRKIENDIDKDTAFINILKKIYSECNDDLQFLLFAVHFLKFIEDSKPQNLSARKFIASCFISKVPHSLIADICQTALTILTSPDNQLLFQSALHVTNYLQSNKSSAYLEKLPPDTAIAIKAIVEEANL